MQTILPTYLFSILNQRPFFSGSWKILDDIQWFYPTAMDFCCEIPPVCSSVGGNGENVVNVGNVGNGGHVGNVVNVGSRWCKLGLLRAQSEGCQVSAETQRAVDSTELP